MQDQKKLRKIERQVSEALAECPPTDTAKTCRFAARVVAKRVVELCDEDKNDALLVQDAAWHDIEDKHLADLAAAQAQVAVMTDLLQVLLARHTAAATVDANLKAHKQGLEYSGQTKCGCGLCKEINQALSAAPKVKGVE